MTLGKNLIIGLGSIIIPPDPGLDLTIVGIQGNKSRLKGPKRVCYAVTQRNGIIAKPFPGKDLPGSDLLRPFPNIVVFYFTVYQGSEVFFD